MEPTSILDRFKDLLVATVKARREKVWTRARQDLADTVKHMNTVLGDLTGGALFIKLTHGGVIQDYDDIHLELWNQNSSTRLGAIVRFLINKKTDTYPLLLVLPDGNQLPLGDKEALHAALFGNFAAPRTALIEQIDNAMQGKIE